MHAGTKNKRNNQGSSDSIGRNGRTSEGKIWETQNEIQNINQECTLSKRRQLY